MYGVSTGPQSLAAAGLPRLSVNRLSFAESSFYFSPVAAVAKFVTTQPPNTSPPNSRAAESEVEFNSSPGQEALIGSAWVHPSSADTTPRLEPGHGSLLDRLQLAANWG